MDGENIQTDAKIRWGTISVDHPIGSHAHKKGHFTVIIGDVRMLTPVGEFRVVNDWFFVPAEMVHEIHANVPSKYFCIGAPEF